MKKSVFIFLILLSCIKSISQNVGIGTTSPASSAQLDISSTSKGLLIPRMTKTQKNAILSPVIGLLVYQNGPDSSGFHYYTGSSWLWLEPVSSAGWKVAGNAGTDTAVNFFGTTDNMPLRFKQNNQWLGQWNSNNRTFFIGRNAGKSNLTGTGLVTIGDSSLLNNISGYENIAIGYKSLLSNTSGYQNISIGDSALRLNTTGFASIAIGNRALEISTAPWNIAIGRNALKETTVGDKNLAIGEGSLGNNITGSDNIALGYGSMLYGAAGDGNIGLGFFALDSNSGNKNIAIGYDALRRAHSASDNIAIGTESMYFGSSGQNNIAIGFRAMYNGPSGISNVVLGAAALADITTGNNNVAVGSGTAQFNTTGSNNTALGTNALVNNTTGSSNVALGTYTLRFRTGFGNVAIGAEAGGSGVPVIPETIQFNTLIGHRAGTLLLGDGNIFIGYEAGANETGVSNRLIIHNNSTTAPLLTGDFVNRYFKTQGFFEVADSSTLFHAVGNVPVTPANVPIAGEGRRTMWYTDKAAFRTGYVSSTNWDKDSIGNYSFAAGADVKAKGSSSVALGNNSQALTNESFAMGNNAVAAGLGARALGLNALANGDQSTAIGFNTTASGIYAAAFNSNTTAAAIAAVATGGFTISSGDYSSAHGRFTKSKSYAGVVIGTFNDSTNAANPSAINGANRLFQIGNGIADNLRNNAFTVLHNGAIGFNTSSPVTLIDANGDLALRQNEVTVVNGVNNDVSTGPYSFVKVTGPSAAFSLSGFTGGVDGKILTVLNLTGQNMTIVNQTGSGSITANRINTLSGADIVTTGNGSVTMQYSIADNRWMVIAVRD